MKKNILIVNWGTPTAIYVLKECIQLKKYNFYLAATKKIPNEIKKIFTKDRIIFTNPYDSLVLCEDVQKYIIQNSIKFDIVTTFFEMSVYQAAFLADFLGVEKRLSVSSAIKTSVDKYLMRLELKKNKIDQPKFYKFDFRNIKSGFIFFKNIGTDVILKPVHSGHSYGVRFLKKDLNFKNFLAIAQKAKNDLSKNYDEWMKYEKLEECEFLLEEFIEGKVFSFDGIVADLGEINFIGSTEFEMSSLPMMQQIGHSSPIFSLTFNQQKKSKKYIEKIIRTLGLKYCGFHCEIKFFKGKPYLIEIAGRLPGAIILRTYRNISKINLFDRFFAVFEEDKKEKPIKKNESFLSESMKIVFADKPIGVVKNGVGFIKKEFNDYQYEIRSRKNGEKIMEKDNPFGIWLYEVIIRSKKIKIDKLIEKRNEIIENYNIYVKRNLILVLVFGLKKIFKKTK